MVSLLRNRFPGALGTGEKEAPRRGQCAHAACGEKGLTTYSAFQTLYCWFCLYKCVVGFKYVD